MGQVTIFAVDRNEELGFDEAEHHLELFPTGVAVDVDERERLVTDLGGTNNMVLRNHGLLTVGKSASEAGGRMWNLERACQVQVLAMSTGQPLHQAPIAAIEKTSALLRDDPGGMTWGWLLRQLDAKDPSFRN